jgi:putative hydrolase of the HAD superfamily
MTFANKHQKGTSMTTAQITTLFLDIGGVLLTNGWDRHARRRAADNFGLDYDEMDDRHHLTFDNYEEGKLSLESYLTRVVFHRERPFSREDFKNFMFAQSEALPEMIEVMQRIKQRYALVVGAISNEGRELTVFRIKKFDLKSFFDFFVSSCFVHFRKPDEDMYRIALDIAQAAPERSVYIDDRALFVEVAKSLGINGIHHVGYDSTRQALADYGLYL